MKWHEYCQQVKKGLIFQGKLTYIYAHNYICTDIYTIPTYICTHMQWNPVITRPDLKRIWIYHDDSLDLAFFISKVNQQTKRWLNANPLFSQWHCVDPHDGIVTRFHSICILRYTIYIYNYRGYAHDENTPVLTTDTRIEDMERL